MDKKEIIDKVKDLAEDAKDKVSKEDIEKVKDKAGDILEKFTKKDKKDD